MVVIVAAFVIVFVALVGVVLAMLRMSAVDQPGLPPADETTRMWEQIRAALNRPTKENL